MISLLVYTLKNLSNEEQVVVIHARTVLTLAEKVTALPNRSQDSGMVQVEICSMNVALD